MEYEHSASMAISFDTTQTILRCPHVYMHPKIYPDGNQWCCIYGENLQDGIAGFGDTVEKACNAFDKNWFGQKLMINPKINRNDTERLNWLEKNMECHTEKEGECDFWTWKNAKLTNKDLRQAIDLSMNNLKK